MSKIGLNKIVLGLSVESGEYWLLAINTIISFKKANKDIKLSEIRICTTDSYNFRLFRKIIKNFYDCKCTMIFPDESYKGIVPKLNKSYSTYWKFDLFKAIKRSELFLYLDCDVISINPFEISYIKNLFIENKNVKLLAVKNPRNTFERFFTLNLNSPFDYFNAGILFMVKNNLINKNSISKAIKIFSNEGIDGLHWHDQDIINYIFKNNYIGLNPKFNLHTGYFKKIYYGNDKFNQLFINSISKPYFIHFSGNHIFNGIYHPFNFEFNQQFNSLKSFFKLKRNNLSSEENSKILELIYRFDRLRKKNKLNLKYYILYIKIYFTFVKFDKSWLRG